MAPLRGKLKNKRSMQTANASSTKNKRRQLVRVSKSSKNAVSKDLYDDSESAAAHETKQLHTTSRRKRSRNARAAHNSTQSPLLVLPAEIREMIFTYALGGQHIHILSEAPVVGSGTGYLPAAKRFTGLGKVSYRKNHYTRKDYMAAQSEFWNVAFPIDWQQHVDTQPTTAPLIYFYPLPTSDRPPNSLARVIKSSNRHMRLFFAACRQIYQETRLLPYALNEFSFQDPWTMLTWLANRELFQKTALNTLWFDLEWYEQSLFIFPEDKSMKFLHHTGVTNIKISSLAMKTTYDWYARRSFWRSSPRHVRGNKVLQMYEKQYIERIENLFDNNNLHIEFVE